MTDQNLDIFKGKTSELPSFAKQSAGLGMENVNHSDMSTPQIKVMQAMSPELQEMDHVKAGHLFNTVSREVSDSLYCVNLYYETQYTIFNKKARQRVDTAGSAEEAQTIIAGLPGSADDYEMQDTKVNYCVALDIDAKGNMNVQTPFIMYMKKTQVRVSNDWNTEINNRYGSQTARWAGVWKLSTKKRSNDSGTWFVPSVEFAGYIQDKGLFDELTKTYEAISGKKTAAAA